MAIPMPSTVILDSPVEHTLNVLGNRLEFAAEETKKLSKQLVNYGFQRLPAEKPEEVDHNKSDGYKQLNAETNGRKYETVVSRLCHTESIIQSMKDGIQSINDEGNITKAQLIKEKDDIRGSYSKEIYKLKGKLEQSQSKLQSYADAKSSLEKQIGKLKKELTKRINTQRNIMEKITEKDFELNAFQEKLSKLTKESGKQKSDQKKYEELQSAMITKISELEAIVETERINVLKLSEKCSSLTGDAMLARQEFEKEFQTRVQLETFFAEHEEDFELSNKRIDELINEVKTLQRENEQQRANIKTLATAKERQSQILESTSVANQKLKEALQIAVVDKNALMEKEKESSARQKSSVESLLAQQNKALDCTKKTFVAQLEKQQQQIEATQTENLKLMSEIHESNVKLEECEFKMKLLQQNHESELKKLHTTLSCERKMKAELVEKLQALENELNVRDQQVRSLGDEYITLKRDRDILQNNYSELETRHAEVSEKVSWMVISNESNEQIKQKMADMISEKNKLAYEKGILQEKLSEVQEEAKMLNDIKFNEKIEEMKSKKSVLQQKNRELTEELHQLAMRKDEDAKRFTQEIDLLDARIATTTSEQKTATGHFKTLMSTNDQLQTDMQNIQEMLGRKDLKLQKLISEREENANVIEDMKGQLDTLNNKIDAIEQVNKDEISMWQKKLDTAKQENVKLRNANAEIKKIPKQLEEDLSNLQTQIKDKDKELRKCVKSKDQQLKSQKKQHEADLKSLQNNYRKEIGKSLDTEIRELVEEKNIYVEKNSQQAELLETFMKQITSLQSGLSTIIEEQNQTESLLKEKDECIKCEKAKRKKMQQKYDAMVISQRIDNVESSSKQLLVSVKQSKDDKTSTNVHRNLIEEKLQTQNAVKKYKNAMDKEKKSMTKLEENITDIHRHRTSRPSA